MGVLLTDYHSEHQNKEQIFIFTYLKMYILKNSIILKILELPNIFCL